MAVVEAWHWDACVAISSVVGVLLMLYGLAMYMCSYRRRNPALFPSNTWNLHIMLWFGNAALFLAVMMYMSEHCRLRNFWWSVAFLSLPFSVCFSCLFVLALNSMIICRARQYVPERFLMFLAAFLSIILPAMHSQFTETVRHYTKMSTFVYVYALSSGTLCLNSWKAFGYGKLVFTTNAICWGALSTILYVNGCVLNGPLIVFCAWTILCHMLYTVFHGLDVTGERADGRPDGGKEPDAAPATPGDNARATLKQTVGNESNRGLPASKCIRRQVAVSGSKDNEDPAETYHVAQSSFISLCFKNSDCKD
ncbi:protein E2 [Elephant endotheliotropic herpesvirus 5B]|nr:protein E2 [Elephant endotheliotropic herpesvirus 5B]